MMHKKEPPSRISMAALRIDSVDYFFFVVAFFFVVVVVVVCVGGT